MKKAYLVFFLFLISWSCSGLSLNNTRWEIVGVAKFEGVIGAYTKEQTDLYLHGVVGYLQDSVSFNGKGFPIIKSRSESWTSDDLYHETAGTGSKGLTFKEIGFSGTEIGVLSLRLKDYQYPGSFLLLVSPDTMLTQYNGVFYWMKIIEPK